MSPKPASTPRSQNSINPEPAGNIVCEKPTRGDWVAMGEIYNQSVRTRSIPQLNPMTSEQSLAYFSRCEAGNIPTIVARLNGEVVGWLMAHSMTWGGISTSTTADLCIYVDASHTGKLSGVALRMISTSMRPIILAGFERLTIWTYSENTASQDLAHSFGMERWGLLPGVAKMDDNVYKDVVIWGIELTDAALQRWDRLMKRLSRNTDRTPTSPLNSPGHG